MRGALMGVNGLLETLGFDFIAPDETLLPPDDGVITYDSTLDITYVPVFE